MEAASPLSLEDMRSLVIRAVTEYLKSVAASLALVSCKHLFKIGFTLLPACAQGSDAAVLRATQIVCAAVQRYKHLCEGACQGAAPRA